MAALTEGAVGKGETVIRHFTEDERIAAGYVTGILRLALLASDIVEVIVEGRRLEAMETRPQLLEWNARKRAWLEHLSRKPVDHANRGRQCSRRVDDEVGTNLRVLTIARCVFTGLNLDGTQAGILRSTDVGFDVVPDHQDFARVETKIIERQVEKRARRFADDLCPDVGGVLERGDERAKVERDPTVTAAVTIAVQSDKPGPRAQHAEKLIEPSPSKVLMEVAYNDALWIGFHEFEDREIFAERCRGGQM